MNSVHKQAVYLWCGLTLALSLFFVNTQIFIRPLKPLPMDQLEWIFALLGLITFTFGVLFFKGYMALNKASWKKMNPTQRGQGILLAYVFQWVLFESLGLCGVLLSVLRQSTDRALPFLGLSYLGFVAFFPRKKVIEDYIRKP